mmetsp:Transcript_52462/g.86841  ORF Transcript_52462/g.86841 Transcript_52462/m.86841 type:complete len:561 (+) Transcript_52462:51-1733(+)
MASGYASIEFNGQHSDSDSLSNSATDSERIEPLALDETSSKHQQRAVNGNMEMGMTSTQLPMHAFDGEQSESDDTKSYHDEDEVITIHCDTRTPRTSKNASSSLVRKYHIDTFAKYKQCLLQEYCGIHRRSCLPLFRFKSDTDERQFPLFVDQQYRVIHYVCLLLMLVQVFVLYVVHLSLDANVSWQFAMDTDFYAMLAFVVTLFALLTTAIVCDQCECCHSMENDIVPRYSTTAFTTGVGLILLYIVIMYTVVGSLTTDRFLVYFVLTLTWNACVGHIRTTHYVILACTVFIEYALFACLRWRQVITVTTSTDSTTTPSPNDNNWLLSSQTEGHVTDAEFVFASLVVLFTVLYVGGYVGRQQRQLCFEYIQTRHMQHYIRHGKIALTDLATQILDGYHLKELSDFNVDLNTTLNHHHHHQLLQKQARQHPIFQVTYRRYVPSQTPTPTQKCTPTKTKPHHQKQKRRRQRQVRLMWHILRNIHRSVFPIFITKKRTRMVSDLRVNSWTATAALVVPPPLSIVRRFSAIASLRRNVIGCVIVSRSMSRRRWVNAMRVGTAT